MASCSSEGTAPGANDPPGAKAPSEDSRDAPDNRPPERTAFGALPRARVPLAPAPCERDDAGLAQTRVLARARVVLARSKDSRGAQAKQPPGRTAFGALPRARVPLAPSPCERDDAGLAQARVLARARVVLTRAQG